MLAAYRKYGSREARWRVSEKSCCSADEVAANARNGSPIELTYEFKADGEARNLLPHSGEM